MLVYCHLCPTLLPSLPAYADHLQAKNGHNIVRLDSVNKLVALRAALIKVKGDQAEEDNSKLGKVVHQTEKDANMSAKDAKMGDQIVVNNDDIPLGEVHDDQEQKVTSDKPLHVCPTCKQTFRYQGNLHTHVKRTHQKLRKFRCPEVSCDATFFRVATQQEHLRSKHRWLVKDQLEQVTCGEVGCGKIFSSKGNLTVHKKIVHMKILPFKCTDCGKGFFRPALLEQHRRARHGGAKIECPVSGCGSKFTAVCNLSTHRKKMHKQKSTKEEVEQIDKCEEVKKVVIHQSSEIVQGDSVGESISEAQ